MLHIIGQISLNLSTFIYFIWFLPQLALTFKRKSTNGLSLLMHSVLMLGYIFDLMYGFGQHLPIQYRMVTIIGLTSLLIEHYQFARFGLNTRNEKRLFQFISIGFIILFGFVIYNLVFDQHSKFYYDSVGFVSMFCWLLFVWPQIIKNYRQQSTQGLSNKFVTLTILTSLLDTISAFALNWPIPSKISAPLGLMQKMILFGQCYYYKKAYDLSTPEVKYS